MNLDLRLWKCLLTCLLLSFLIGCASTGSPSGGPRDRTPPGLVKEESSPNFSTNYTPDRLELVFDEWIELKNQQREILISPPFFKNPKISSRGKKITVEFPEEEPLREDATYTINFGKSIVDFTEGNAAEGFRFVFATGDRIDSLIFSGKIIEAKESKPVKDILVLLYDLVEDSVVVKEKPFYYARTDDKGVFKFENLKNDTFKLFVLEDLNFNYLLDPEVERLAFPDSLFILNDSSSYSPTLRLFKPEQRLRITNSSSQTPGLITTVFNKQASEAEYSVLYPNGFDPIVEKSKDTLMFWFKETLDSVGVVYGNDTLDFTIKAFDSLFYNKELLVLGTNTNKTVLAPFDSLKISFSSPIASMDSSLMRLTDQPVNIPVRSDRDTIMTNKNRLLKDSIQIDSLNTLNDTLLSPLDSLPMIKDSITLPKDTSFSKLETDVEDPVPVDSTLINQESLFVDSTVIAGDTSLIAYDFGYRSTFRNLIIDSKWKDNAAYRLELLPGAITDIYGRQNDTLILDFKTASRDEFGNIAINLSGLDSGQMYVVLLKLKDEIVRKNIVSDSTLNRIEHTRLGVNTYSVELIKDDDGNGKWTTGDYWEKRQPEELKTFELEKLKQNWDLEANVFWNEIKAPAIDTTGVEQDSSVVNPQLPGLGKKPESPKPKNRLPEDVKNKKQRGKND